MIHNEGYFFKQSEWMLSLIPFIAKEKCFALKGGTAINFFIRDMPRLSVDLDLTYLPLEDRETSLNNISLALKRIAHSIKSFYKNATVRESIRNNRIAKIIVVHSEGFPVIIEPNEIIRGALYEVQERSVSQKVENTFEISASMQVLSIEDLYGGKLCAALDRQHPRDLFDVKMLLENEGITEKIKKSFLVYLASHDRPMHELLNPSFKNVFDSYEKEFLGMTNSIVQYDELVNTREKCLSFIKNSLNSKDKEFLLSIKMGAPQWGLIDIPNIEKLPSLKWKILNIKKMNAQKQKLYIDKLKEVLDV